MSAIRKFIRHPSDIPIVVSKVEELNKSLQSTSSVKYKMKNASLGGVAFFSSETFDINCHVSLSVPCLSNENSVEGQVLWCKKLAKGYDVGVEFDDLKTIFKLRMIEQICHIEHYRKQVKTLEDRQITSEQAAVEWINKFAAEFPSFDSSH